MAGESTAYLPFRGFSAWFSCSVNPSTVKLWEQHGGLLAGENEALYLFSDDAFTKDTVRLYKLQKDIIVVQSSWIRDTVQKQCPARCIPLSRHLLTPHFMVGLDLVSKDEAGKTPESSRHGGEKSHTEKSHTEKSHMEKSHVADRNRVAERSQGGEKSHSGERSHVPERSCMADKHSPSSLYSLYNSVWNKLEQDSSDNVPESISHVRDIERATTQAPFDFILSDPEFKVYKKN